MRKSASSFPLIPNQRDFYFDQLLRSECPSYNVGGYLALGRIDAKRLAKAHRDLVKGHDAFGIRIARSRDGIAQRVVLQRTTALHAVDLSLDPQPRDAARAWIRDLFATPLAFENAELFKSALIKLGDSEYWYVGVAHHLAIDGWGCANWGHALARYYNGEEGDQSLSWSGTAMAQDAYLQGDKYQRDRAHWARRCESLPERLLQPFHAAGAGDGAVRSFRLTQQISPALFARVEHFAAEVGVGPHAVLLGALATCLGQMYRQTDLLIRVAIHNRSGAAEKRQIGTFSSISPLRLEAVTGVSFSALVQEVAHRQKADYRHRRYPHGDLLRDLGLAGGRVMLGDVGFSYLKAESTLEIEGRGLALTYVSHACEATPLMVTVWDVLANAGVEVHFDCNRAYFNGAEAGLLGSRIMRVLERALSAPEAILQSADVLLEGERGQLLEQFNASTRVDPDDSLVHALFERQAVLQPEAVALVHADQSLTYGELNQRVFCL